MGFLNLFIEFLHSLRAKTNLRVSGNVENRILFSPGAKRWVHFTVEKKNREPGPADLKTMLKLVPAKQSVFSAFEALEVSEFWPKMGTPVPFPGAI